MKRVWCKCKAVFAFKDGIRKHSLPYCDWCDREAGWEMLGKHVRHVA